MKNKYIILAITWAVFIYFCMSFLTLQVNPLLWIMPFKILFILFGVLMPMISILVTIIDNDEN